MAKKGIVKAKKSKKKEKEEDKDKKDEDEDKDGDEDEDEWVAGTVFLSIKCLISLYTTHSF